jgi:inner membrane protein
MFIFAHVGITLGGALLVSGAAAGCRHLRKKENIVSSNEGNIAAEGQNSFPETIGLNSLARFLDLRILIIGSLFPDLIDKPLSFFGFSDGRSITHTLLVAVIILLAGLFLWQNLKKTWLLAISIGTIAHLILDSMWTGPQVLFWPLHGMSFPSADHSFSFDQIGIWWHILITNIGVDISEIIGILIILFLLIVILQQRQFKSLALKGKMAS